VPRRRPTCAVCETADATELMDPRIAEDQELLPGVGAAGRGGREKQEEAVLLLLLLLPVPSRATGELAGEGLVIVTRDSVALISGEHVTEVSS
jgi:hypothetical protein